VTRYFGIRSVFRGPEAPTASVEASALTHSGVHGHVRGPTPLLRIQSDERLVALTRRGNQAAYEALVGRYQSRLLAFCRHMLGSREDAEDVLQEVFAAAFNAMMGDDRPLNVRPWLYRIARNRSLNHLRRAQAIGVDSMDVHLSEHGTTTADKVHKREEFRQLMEDVQGLPETQRTALLLREIDALSYEQIAEAMETTVPSIKSLLVRARVSLAEAAEARMLTCDEVREELGEVAEGLKRTTAPIRRHLRTCDRCVAFRKSLRDTNKALASMLPVGPLLLLKKLLLANLGTTASAGGGAAAAAGAGAAGAGAGGAVSASMSVVASKAAATVAAAAIVTVGTVEVDQVRHHRQPTPAAITARHTPAAAAPATPVVVASQAQPAVAPLRHTTPPAHREPAVTEKAPSPSDSAAKKDADAKKKKSAKDALTDPATASGGTAAGDPAALQRTGGAAVANPAAPQQESDTSTLPAEQPGSASSGGVVAPDEPTPSAPAPPATTAPPPPPAQTAPPPATTSAPTSPPPADPPSSGGSAPSGPTGGTAPSTPAGGTVAPGG
jgi:RNA polymerase sigma factor (sigma-70 family)